VRVERAGRDGLRVSGLRAAEVGHLAFVSRIELHELATEHSGLEQVFFALTTHPAALETAS
jgi:hypothetical protein